MKDNMNTAEIKLDLFRRIDNLSDAELKKRYDMITAVLGNSSEYKLNPGEQKAVDEAIADSKTGKVFTSEQVMSEAKQKYPNLKFK
jgi:predicted transcriptional regulator